MWGIQFKRWQFSRKLYFKAVNELSPYLFWDVDRKTIKLEKHQAWLVKRVLEKGTLNDWKILQNLLNRDQLKATVKGLKNLEKKAASFACAVLEIEPEELRCYTEKQSLSTHWSY
mgnify:CR=1 FL=1